MTEPANTLAAERALSPWPALARTAALVLVSFAGGLFLLYGVLQQGPSGLLRWIDIAAGAVASLALILRRRAPVIVAIVLIVPAAFFASAGLANMLALYAVARHRRLVVALAIGAGDLAAGCVFWLLYPHNNSFTLTVTVNVAIAAAVTAWGALLQAQRALVDSYRERAERVEREQQLREQQVRIAERTRIAREMHDAVAHRISLIALHAGGLAVAPDPSRDDVRSTAIVIRSGAGQALEELRAVLGVLRADEPASLEQPGLDRITDLVADGRAAGQQIVCEFSPDLAELSQRVSPGVGRAAYRIVQEGLTNARKHAPGATVSVQIRADDQLQVIISNPAESTSLGLPGSGGGLIGLTERAALTGGSLRYGSTIDGFQLVAELPLTDRSKR